MPLVGSAYLGYWVLKAGPWGLERCGASRQPLSGLGVYSMYMVQHVHDEQQRPNQCIIGIYACWCVVLQQKHSRPARRQFAGRREADTKQSCCCSPGTTASAITSKSRRPTAAIKVGWVDLIVVDAELVGKGYSRALMGSRDANEDRGRINCSVLETVVNCVGLGCYPISLDVGKAATEASRRATYASADVRSEE